MLLCTGCSHKTYTSITCNKGQLSRHKSQFVIHYSLILVGNRKLRNKYDKRDVLQKVPN